MIRSFFLALALGLAPVSVAIAQAPEQGVCIISSVEGGAMVFARGVKSRAAEVGLGMGRSATLRTEAEGRVTLQCNDDLRVIVGPGSEHMVMRLMQEAPQTFGMRLKQGIAGFLFTAGEDGGSVEIRAPSAVAAVRSTQWAMQVTDRASAVFAREGTVAVSGQTGKVQLTPGDGVDVSSGGTLKPVVKWGQRRIDLYADLLGPDW